MAHVRVSEDGNSLHLLLPYEQRHWAKMQGGKWNPSVKAWDFIFNPPQVVPILEALIRDDPSFQVEKVVLDMLDAKQDELDNVAKIITAAELNEPVTLTVPGLLLPLYNYQKHGVIFGTSLSSGLLIADSMGLGKSVQGIATALLRRQEGAKSCLIVCPASLKYNWLEEIEKFTGETATVIEGTPESRWGLWHINTSYFKIVNYEILVRDIYDEKTRIPDADLWLKKGVDMCIVDEIHLIKTHKAKRTKALKKLRARYRIGLTGTPLDGRLEELHSIYEFLQPGLLRSRYDFLKHHAMFDYWGGVKGYKHVDQFKRAIRPFFIRRLKTEVLKDLPEKVHQDVWVELSGAELKTYRSMARRKHEITESSEAMTAVLRCRQFCDFPDILDLEGKSAKFDTLLEVLADIARDPMAKVIIFSQYKEVTNRLVKLLPYQLIYLSGETPAKERQAMCHRFNDDPDVRIIVMTDAGSLGLNLQGASYVIHYDDNYSPAVMSQREDRAHRLGQKGCVNVIRFICRDTVEERVRGILEKKAIVTGSVLDEDYSEFSTGSIRPQDILNLL